MEKLISPPHPNEQTVTTIVTREVAFPNGRIARISMSQWHWEMIAFCDLWNDHYKREHGILYEFYKKIPNSTDQMISDAVMLRMRDSYTEWHDGLPEHEEALFNDPRT